MKYPVYGLENVNRRSDTPSFYLWTHEYTSVSIVKVVCDSVPTFLLFLGDLFADIIYLLV